MKQLFITKNKKKSALLTERAFFGVLIALFVFLIQTIYCYYVAPPQMGWWQYYGWRITEGDVLYKDLYCFLQPYYVWLSALLYRIFGANFAWYATLGILLRTLAITAVYHMVSARVQPQFAFFACLAGFAVSISYLMDMAFDYNTVILYLLVATAYLATKAYAAPTGKRRRIYLAAVGVLSGVHFMMKQSSGIAVPFATAVLIAVLSAKERGGMSALKDLSVYLLGALAAAIPGYVALAAQGALSAYAECLFGSVGAKMGNGLVGILNRFLEEMFKKEEVFFALFCFAAAVFATEGRRVAETLAVTPAEQAAKRRWQLALRTAFFGALLFAVGNFVWYLEEGSKTLLSVLLSALQKIGKVLSGGGSLGGGIASSPALEWAGVAVAIAGLVLFAMLLRAERSLKKRRVLCGMVALFTAALIALVCLADYALLNELYQTKFAVLVKRFLVNVSFYFMLFTLLFEAIRFLFCGNFAFGKRFFIYGVIMGALTLTMLLSSVLEEISATVTVVIFFIVLLSSGEEVRPLLFAQKSRVSRAATVVKNAAVYTACAVTVTIALLSKLCVPYSWHGWHVMPIEESRFPTVQSEVIGLGGYRLNAEDEAAYREILALIEAYTTEQDAVFQFPNVPLFNVLAQRKIPTTAPVTYWDVCPDHMARLAAEELYATPPKMIIWANLSEKLWQLHEDYFRNGEKSGQRDILAFYENYVRTHYEKKAAFDGRAGTGVIEVWVRK